MIRLRHASLPEKYKTYKWLCLSDTAQMHMGEPNYPNSPVPDWSKFNEDFEDFYYLEETRKKGSVMIISNGMEEIGCLCYACFHLKPQAAELDIWLKSKEYCGKGYGSNAIINLCEYLETVYNIKNFIIRPSVRNTRAIRAYEKAGFKKVEKDEKQNTIKDYLIREYISEYGDGDYGFEDTEVLIQTTEN